MDLLSYFPKKGIVEPGATCTITLKVLSTDSENSGEETNTGSRISDGGGYINVSRLLVKSVSVKLSVLQSDRDSGIKFDFQRYWVHGEGSRKVVNVIDSARRPPSPARRPPGSSTTNPNLETLRSRLRVQSQDIFADVAPLPRPPDNFAAFFDEETPPPGPEAPPPAPPQGPEAPSLSMGAPPPGPEAPSSRVVLLGAFSSDFHPSLSRSALVEFSGPGVTDSSLPALLQQRVAECVTAGHEVRALGLIGCAVVKPWPALTYSNLTYPNLAYPNLINPNLSYPNLSYPNPNLSYPNLFHPNPNLSYPNLSYPNLFHPNPNLSYPNPSGDLAPPGLLALTLTGCPNLRLAGIAGGCPNLVTLDLSRCGLTSLEGL